MGILNVTPDSFSDGGSYGCADDAVFAAVQMAEEGADIIDIGGESTRPGRPETVTPEEELERVIPVVRAVRSRLPGILVSVDTYKGAVAREALAAGADIINDIYALRRSPEIASCAATYGAGLLLMHMQGDPATMQQNPQYEDVMREVGQMLCRQIDVAVSSGADPAQICLDPGIGFGKTDEHNLRILAGLGQLRELGRPICVGVSRKGMLGRLTGNAPANEREEASIAASCAAMLHGASVIRVHNVKAGRRAAAIIDAIRQYS